MFFISFGIISVTDYKGFWVTSFIFITQIQMQTAWPENLSEYFHVYFEVFN